MLLLSDLEADLPSTPSASVSSFSSTSSASSSSSAAIWKTVLKGYIVYVWDLSYLALTDCYRLQVLPHLHAAVVMANLASSGQARRKEPITTGSFGPVPAVPVTAVIPTRNVIPLFGLERNGDLLSAYESLLRPI